MAKIAYKKYLNACFYSFSRCFLCYKKKIGEILQKYLGKFITAIWQHTIGAKTKFSLTF